MRITYRDEALPVVAKLKRRGCSCMGGWTGSGVETSLISLEEILEKKTKKKNLFSVPTVVIKEKKDV